MAVSIHPDAVTGTVVAPEDSIAYHDTGGPGDGRGAVVLLHGTGGTTSAHFGTVFPMLAARHRVIGMDFRARRGFAVGDLTAQAEAVIRARTPAEAVDLVGYSLGAVAAADFASRHPDAVRTLTLIAGWVATDRQQLLRHDVWQRLRAAGDERALQEWSTLLAFSPAFLRAKTARELEGIVAARSFREGIEHEYAINRGVDIGHRLGAIECPTLVIGCLDDQIAPVHHSRLLHGGIANARLAEVPAGHAVTVERPAQVFNLIDDFVRAPDAVAAGDRVTSSSI